MGQILLGGIHTSPLVSFPRRFPSLAAAVGIEFAVLLTMAGVTASDVFAPPPNQVRTVVEFVFLGVRHTETACLYARKGEFPLDFLRENTVRAK